MFRLIINWHNVGELYLIYRVLNIFFCISSFFVTSVKRVVRARVASRTSIRFLNACPSSHWANQDLGVESRADLSLKGSLKGNILISKWRLGHCYILFKNIILWHNIHFTKKNWRNIVKYWEKIVFPTHFLKGNSVCRDSFPP